MVNATELPNPFTPLAFLPPPLANQLEASRYLFAATVGVRSNRHLPGRIDLHLAQAYVWDIGLNLGNDYTLLFKHRVRFPTIVYFMSR